MTKEIMKAGEMALKEAPKLLETLNNLLSKSQKLDENDVCEKCDSTLQIIGAVRILIQLSVPKIEDGGNFGVQIQMGFIKKLHEMEKSLSSLYKHLSPLIEKQVKSDQEDLSKKTVTTEETKKVDEEKEVKTSTKTVTTTVQEEVENTKKSSVFLERQIQFVLKQNLVLQRDCIAVLSDFYDKNSDKLKNPRGRAYVY